ncbi:NAD(P)/FAD-dependent oxidoreductase [Longimicrobium sp.]|uniref:flavin-containing monooxygenase n=1 Tax=Longimicrobium sp. TaxID=2029185 RepID=UPI002C00C5C1|nr:NAD(P)/FAD-dependent oxidoreductase [Longimicrobium sp.]HSU12737.1 NAD(P)/FAD-dependent oxidoreductase [Longimicrobium sp.]
MATGTHARVTAMERIGIVGAGLSGLVTAKTFLEEGFGVTVFETEDEVGGVWARSRRYPGLATQNPRDTYAFSDFPMPASYPDWPGGEQVQAYLAAYADRFGVTPHVRLRTRVTRAEPRTDARAGWRVTAAAADGREEAHDVDWLVVCNGVFSEPFIPDLPGRAEFEAAGGRVLHTTQLHDAAEVTGKRVAVVGYAKSAADVACAAVETAREVTLVFRRALWKMPKYFFGRVHLKYVLATRFSEALFRWRHPEGVERVLHSAGKPLVWLLWRGIERTLRRSFALDAHGLTPEAPIDRMVGCTLSLASGGFFDHVRSGRLRVQRGEPARFADGAIELGDGTRVEADVVVFGTGFQQGAAFLPEWVAERVRGEDGNFRLYRSILPPDVPRLAFIGYNSSLYSQLTSEIGARWLVEHARGRFEIPSQAEMRRRIEERLAWLKAERPDSVMNGICVIPFNFHHINELLRDLGARTWRSRNRLHEYMMPVDPSLYAGLRAELQDRRLRRATPREPGVARPTSVG